ANVVELAEVVTESNLVQNSAEGADGHSHSVRAAEAAELPASFEVRLGFEEEARRAEGLHPPLERGQIQLQIPQHVRITRVAAVGRHEVSQPFLVDDARPLEPRIDAIVLDVHPAEVGPHRLVLAEALLAILVLT